MISSWPAPRTNGAASAYDATVDDAAAVDSGAASLERFAQERLLGRGAMGAVYLVRDRETGEQLALKKLFRMDGKSVLRLKREFRSLSDVSHPNLVKLYELGRAPDAWFLTMEYVQGEDLQAYLGLGSGSSGSRSGLGRALAGDLRARIQERVVPAFHQLATGVRALHRAGLLHRDLKPSNVLVAGPRVVVLDFGLARELDPHAPTLTEEGQIAGTPAYMAPEQALGKALSEASDWYAFGAMLYEALTGMLPFDGPVFELLRSKLEHDPQPPVQLDPGVPEPLNALCMALLARDPNARPRGADVLAQLEPPRTRIPTLSLPVSEDTSVQTETQIPAAMPLFGRTAELAALHAARRRAEEPRTVVVHVRGLSGAGKSALVEAFLHEIESEAPFPGRPEALVLRSRCYEREAMPFKALDGVVDAIARHLMHVDDCEVSNLLPTDIATLAQLFPVLERLRAVQRLLMNRARVGDAVNTRQRAEAALRELLGRLATRRPLVIWIDDLQWGDLDSAAILKNWLQRAGNLPILLLFSYRADEIETSECLRMVLAPHGEGGAETQVVQVAPLEHADVHALCRMRLGVRGNDTSKDALIERIVREAQGSPFLAAQLAALAEARLGSAGADLGALSIGDLVTQLNALLPEEAQNLLAVLAVAGRPILPKLALRAAGVRHGGRELLHALRRLQLVRTRDVAGERLLEVYHDRVREGVQRLLAPARSEAIHASLLATLEYSGRADPEWLHTLALGAGERVAALRYGLSAAERATAALAFQRAAELYARCLDLTDHDASHRGELLCKLAAALGACGRGAAAAEAYLQAAELATGAEAVHLMRQATSHLLRTGHFEQGEAMLQRVLAAMDVTMPKTPAAIKREIAWERLRLALRGLRFTPRGESEVPAAVLARYDTFHALRLDTSSIDPLRAALFLARQARWALDAGEPMRVLRALAGIAYQGSITGSARAERRTDELLARMEALAGQIGPEARVEVCIVRALSAWMLNRPEQVIAPSYEAERLLRERPPSLVSGDYYLRLSVLSARIGALYQMFDYPAFAAELEAALQEAQATENRAALLILALNHTLLDEINDRGADAVARLERQRTELPRGVFSVYHALHMVAVCRAAVVAGELEWGLRSLEQDWPGFLKSPVRRTANIEWIAHAVRAQLLAGHYLSQPDRGEVPRALRAELAVLARMARNSTAELSLATLLGRLAYAAQDRARALELMGRVMAVEPRSIEAQRARHALGIMMGGEEGAALCADSERALRACGVVNPISFVRSAYPELLPLR